MNQKDLKDYYYKYYYKYKALKYYLKNSNQMKGGSYPIYNYNTPNIFHKLLMLMFIERLSKNINISYYKILETPNQLEIRAYDLIEFFKKLIQNNENDEKKYDDENDEKKQELNELSDNLGNIIIEDEKKYDDDEYPIKLYFKEVKYEVKEYMHEVTRLGRIDSRSIPSIYLNYKEDKILKMPIANLMEYTDKSKLESELEGLNQYKYLMCISKNGYTLIIKSII